MTRKSRIFTNKELEVIEKRKKGIKEDHTGIFAGRIKPKIIELLEWFGKRKMLKMLIQSRRGK